MHGGFWKSAYGIQPPTSASESLAPDLARRGYAVAEVEYRRSEDEEWGFPHTNHDVSIAIKLARSQPEVDNSRVFVIGHSAGGTLALWHAAQEALARKEDGDDEGMPLVKRTYALAPVADLRMAVEMKLSDDGDAVQRYMHGAPEQIPNRYDCACPTMYVETLADVGLTILVGKKDVDVPEQLVEGFIDKILARENHRESKCVYKVFDGADHYDVVSAGTEPWEWLAADLESQAGLA